MSNMKIANYTFIINPMQKSTHTGFITVQGTVKHWLYIWMHQRFFLVRIPLKAQNAYKTEATQRTHMYNPADVHVYKCRPSERATHIVPTLVSHAFTLNMLPQLSVKQQVSVKLVCLAMNSVITFCHIYIWKCCQRQWTLFEYYPLAL